MAISIFEALPRPVQYFPQAVEIAGPKSRPSVASQTCAEPPLTPHPALARRPLPQGGRVVISERALALDVKLQPDDRVAWKGVVPAVSGRREAGFLGAHGAGIVAKVFSTPGFRAPTDASGFPPFFVYPRHHLVARMQITSDNVYGSAPFSAGLVWETTVYHSEGADAVTNQIYLATWRRKAPSTSNWPTTGERLTRTRGQRCGILTRSNRWRGPVAGRALAAGPTGSLAGRAAHPVIRMSKDGSIPSSI